MVPQIDPDTLESLSDEVAERTGEDIENMVNDLFDDDIDEVRKFRMVVEEEIHEAMSRAWKRYRSSTIDIKSATIKPKVTKRSAPRPR